MSGAARFRAMRRSAVRSDQAARRQRPTAPGDLRLTVVVPAYGEAGRIAASVARIDDATGEVAAAGGVEVLVVDDGSPDATAHEARAAGARVVSLPQNRGKGAAVRAGMLAARGRTVAFIDADLAYDPAQLLSLLTRVEEGFDVVVGSRAHPGSSDEASSVLRRVAGRGFNLVTSAVLLGRYLDTQCGLKAFRSDVARLLFEHSRLNGFAFDVELFHLIERYRLSLAEVPVTLVQAHGSTVHLGVDATRMARDVWRVRRWSVGGVYDAGLDNELVTTAAPPVEG